MDDFSLHAVVARVVAWHNRHPLARRITAAQVDSVGYVTLPYTAPGLPPFAPPAQPAPEPPPAPATAVPPPAPEPVEPVEPLEPVDPDPAIDLAIDSDDPGAIVIDVEPERQAGPAADSQAMTLEVELPTAAPAAPAAPATPPASALRARAAASEGSASSHDPPAPIAMPTPNAPRTLVCSEDFMAPIPVKAVLTWVHTHGLALPHDPGDGPVRQVPIDAALLPAGAGVGQLWVATAAIELGGQRHRVLLGGGAEPAVLGRRAWSRPRLLGALATPCALIASTVWWAWPAAPLAALPTVVVATELAASAASAASASASPASAASAPESSAGAGAVSAHSDTHSANTEAPRLPGLLDEAAKAQARATVAALRAERQASAPALPTAAVATSPPPPPAPAPAPSTDAKTAPPPAALFGLSTRPLRTRAEAEQLQSAFQALLGGAPGSSLRVEMLPAGEDWRVVCWPYERRSDAERARALLQARGLRVELVDF